MKIIHYICKHNVTIIWEIVLFLQTMNKFCSYLSIDNYEKTLLIPSKETNIVALETISHPLSNKTISVEAILD